MRVISFRCTTLITGIVLLFLSQGVMASAMDVPDSIEGTTLITAEKLIELADEFDNLVIVDARIDKDRTGGFIEGAISLPDIITTPEALAKIIPTKTTPVIFYCNGVKCGRSVKSSKMAVENGYTQVYWFKGGWEEWVNKGMPVSK